jgi:hypothetical protein
MSNFYGVVQGSPYQVKPPKKAVKFISEPGAYDRSRIRMDYSNYKYPTNLNTARTMILNSKPYNPSPGTMASKNITIDQTRKPQDYDKYRIYGPSHDARYAMGSILHPTNKNKIKLHNEHTSLQHQMNPLSRTVESIPKAFANAKKKKDDDAKLQAEFARRMGIIAV